MFYVIFECAGQCSELRCDLYVPFDRTVEVVPETNKRFYLAGSNISEAEKEDWRKQAVAFLEMLKMQAMEDKDDKLHAKKQYRLKVYQNLLKLDSFFKELGLPGLIKFQLTGDLGQHSLMDMPFFVFSPDQEGAGLSSYFAMAHLFKVKVWPKFDEMHRVHNDIYLGVSLAGLKSTVILCTILFNLSWGPWTNCSWFEQLRDEAATYFKIASPSDPIFQSMLASMQADSDSGSLAACGPDAAELTCDGLCEVSFLRKKGSRVLLSRWASWLKCMREWTPMWHSRSLLLLVYGITHGFAQKVASGFSLKAALSGSKAPGKDTQMKDQKEEVRKLRDKCSNTMELALHLHCEKTLHQNALMISHCSAGMELWHTRWLQQLRSRPKAFEFNIGLVTGSDTLPCIPDIFANFADEAFLQQVGFTMEDLAATQLYKHLSLQDPIVLADQELAARLGRLVIGLSQQRFVSLAQKMFNLPDLFLCLAHPDGSKRSWVEALLQSIDEAWTAVQPLTSTFWKAVKKNCPMHMPLVQELMHSLRSNGYKASDELVCLCGRVARSFTSSVITERGFQACRAVESEYPDRKMGALEMWSKVVGDKILSEAHSYAEVDHTSLPSARPCKAALPPSLWKLQFKNQSLDFKKVVSTSSTAPYATFSPQSMANMHEGLQLMVGLHAADQLHAGPSAWRTNLIRPGALLQWEGMPGLFMAFSTRGLAVCLWPVVQVRVKASTFYGLQSDIDIMRLQWKSLLEFGSCKVIDYTFACPLDVYLSNNNQLPCPLPKVFGRKASDRLDNPLVSSARFGFSGVPMIIVDKVLKLEFGVSTDGMTAATKLMEAVCKALGIDKLEAATYLEHRLQGSSDADIAAVLETPGVDDVVDASDHQLLEEFCAKAKLQDEGEQSLTTLIRDTRTAASKRGKGRRRAIAFPGDRCITIEEARSMLPPGYSIRRDSHQKRWQVFMAMHLHDGSRWSKSSSWGIAGDERTAALSVLRAAWARHCSLHGEVNPLQ